MVNFTIPRGIFLGGVAQGMQAQQKIGLAERRQQAQEDQWKTRQINARVADTAKVLQNLGSKMVAAGNKPDQVVEALSQLIASTEKVAGQALPYLHSMAATIAHTPAPGQPPRVTRGQTGQPVVIYPNMAHPEQTRFISQPAPPTPQWQMGPGASTSAPEQPATFDDRFSGAGQQQTGVSQGGALHPAVNIPPGTPLNVRLDYAAKNEIHGKDFLNIIPASLWNNVVGLANYTIDPMSFSSRGNATGGRIPRSLAVSLAKQYNPNFDQRQYFASRKALQQFTSGGLNAPASVITNGNTAIYHLGTVWKAVQELKGQTGFLPDLGKSNIPFVSYAANALHNRAIRGTQTGAALARLLEARTLVSSELERFYSGGVGSQAEREQLQNNMDTALSLPELEAAIRTAVHLIEGKVEALQGQWTIAMGGPSAYAANTAKIPRFPVIHQRAQQILDMINNAAPTAGAPAAGVQQTPSGLQFRIVQ